MPGLALVYLPRAVVSSQIAAALFLGGRLSRGQDHDTVRLKEDIDLGDRVHAPAATLGSIVEVLNQGEVYLVECFGDWTS
ncbi:hypothetical protein XM38_052550 [Halomicronema hongdechloris C2206]|uniref:Uncharacterized protein n=1 Tax=Halomicronema hongdechloris C2206 TaxID=1641165 RepID=A0A1Z3HVE0_9CYAN|nr:hypothetical protein XM38_052550 [Halomicronema hongdechloris C2206]